MFIKCKIIVYDLKKITQGNNFDLIQNHRYFLLNPFESSIHATKDRKGGWYNFP